LNARQKRFNAITSEIVAWLDGADFARAREIVQGWDQAGWKIAQDVAFMQGIGPYLSQILPQTPLYPSLPAWFCEWLETTYALNAARISRLHADLQVLLHEAHHADIPLMPLKGSLLTTQVYPQPAIRPMADLDLLIQAKDRCRMRQIMERQGYRFFPKAGSSYHDIYVNTAAETVIAADEHPDNPRPVELHLRLNPRLWAGFHLPDLADDLWQTSTPGTLLGEPVYLPSPRNHLAFVALHHLKHFTMRSGRAIQWLDIAQMVAAGSDLESLPRLDLLYPVLRFSARVFPSYFTKVDWMKLARGVHPRVRNWCEATPLDARCGLQMTAGKATGDLWRTRWIRWRPTPVRLALTYGRTPLLWAYLRYGAALVRHAAGSMMNRGQHEFDETGRNESRFS